MTKTYNTPKRTHIVKTRLDDEEHVDFLRRMELYGMTNQSLSVKQSPVQPSVPLSLPQI